MATETVLVPLTETEVSLLLEALDAYAYWQPGNVLPRNDGEVFIPGDLAPGSDRYWDDQTITEEQHEAIDEVRACRALSARLRNASQDRTSG